MTWGSQNTTEEGHAQIDMSLDHGINFIDTAEAYPVNPMSKETQGETERIIGKWLAKTGRRDDIILASKVAGAGAGSVRNGEPISRATITQAVDGLAEPRVVYVPSELGLRSDETEQGRDAGQYGRSA
jgi:aryl-alcohol dehydrogenase-like predicted oxidoreductase